MSRNNILTSAFDGVVIYYFTHAQYITSNDRWLDFATDLNTIERILLRRNNGSLGNMRCGEKSDSS